MSTMPDDWRTHDETPTEGPDLAAFQWARQYWPEVRWDWEGNAPFYRRAYAQSVAYRAELARGGTYAI